MEGWLAGCIGNRNKWVEASMGFVDADAYVDGCICVRGASG